MTYYQAGLYHASSPNAQYLGSLLTSFTQNVRDDIFHPILQKHGLDHVDPTAWYQQQKVLNILRDLESHFSFEELVEMAISATDHHPAAFQFHAIEALLMASDDLYKSQCRNIHPDEGMVVNKATNRHYQIVFNVPLPAFCVYGTFYGLLYHVKNQHENLYISLTHRDTPAVMDVKW